jgi:hypothetical protein
MLDLSELPVLDNIFSFSDSHLSLLDLISRVCEYAGYEFFVETNLYALGEMSSIPFGFCGHVADDVIRWIKIKTVGRGLESVYASNVDSAVNSNVEDRLDRFGSITSLVDNESFGINQNERGIELCDNVTNAVVVGDYRADVHQIVANFDAFNDINSAR